MLIRTITTIRFVVSSATIGMLAAYYPASAADPAPAAAPQTASPVTPHVADLGLSEPSEQEVAGWKKLLENDATAALTLFEQAGGSLSALEGVYQCQRMLGDDAAVWKTLERMTELAIATPAGRYFFDRLRAEQGWTGRAASFRAIVDRLLERNGNPDALRALTNSRYARASNQLDAAGMTAFVAKSGAILHYARLIGPFHMKEHTPVNALPVFPPQLHPAEPTYEDFNGYPVKTALNFSHPSDRWVTLREVLPQSPGANVYFAQLTLRSPREQAIILDCDDVDAVWLNGWQIFAPELFQQKDGYPKQVKTPLRKGVNTLLMMINDGSGLETRIMDEQGGPAEVESLPFQAADWKDSACRLSAGWTFSAITDPVPLRALRGYAARNAESLPAKLWLADCMEMTGRYEEAEDIWRQLSAFEPKSTLICDGYGHFLRRLAERGHGSKTRLHKQAGELFTRALEQRPGDLNATLGLTFLNTTAPEDTEKDDSERAHAAPASAGDSSLTSDAQHPAHRLGKRTEESGRMILGRRSSDPVFQIDSGYYKVSGQIPQEDYLRQLEQLQATHPASLALLRVLSFSYLEKTWSAPARALVTAYAAANPEDLEGLAKLYGRLGEEVTRNKLLDELGQTEWYHDWLDRLIATARYDEARKLLEQIRALYPSDHETYYDNLSAILLRCGDLSGAAEALDSLALHQPYQRHLPVRQGELALRRGDTAAAIRYFTRAQELNAAAGEFSPELQERLRALRNEPPFYAGTDLSLDPAAAAKIKKEEHPRANFATMIRLRTVRLYPGGATESFEHHAVKVFDKSGIEALSELPLPHGRVLSCRTVQPDGKVFIPDSAENIAFGKAMSMYNVRPGSTLDYSFRQSDDTADDSFDDAFEFEDFDTPVVFARYTLTLPKEMLNRASITTVPEDFAPTVTEQDGLVTLVWETHELPGRESEDNLPPDQPVLTSVSISVACPEGNVYQTVNTLKPAAAPRLTPELQAHAASLIAGCTTPRQKALRIFNWVADEIAEQSGEGEATPHDTLILRSGSNGERAELCRTLLAAAGIEACSAETNTSFTRAGYVDPATRADAADGFNANDLLKVILPGEPEDLWLNFHGNQRFYRAGDIGTDLSGALARERTDTGIRLSYVRPAVSEMRVRRAPDSIELHPDGSATVRCAVTFYGSTAGAVRGYLENPHQASEFLSGFSSRLYPRLTTPEFQSPSGKELTDNTALTQPLVLGFTGAIADFCSRSGERLTFPAFGGDTPYASATPLPREHPLHIGNDTIYFDTRIFHAPEGWTFINIPRDMYITSPFGVAVLDCNVIGRKLHITRYLLAPAMQLSPEECPAFNQFVSELQTIDQATVSLEPSPAGLPRTAIEDPGRTLPLNPLPLLTFQLPENVAELLDAPEDTADNRSQTAPGSDTNDDDQKAAPSKPAAQKKR